jgi:hypothetical protein
MGALLQQFQQYPRVMNHPHHKPATHTVIPDPPLPGGGKLPGVYKPTVQGTPEVFPPVTVSNEDQEAEYRAKGYLPAGVMDPNAYAAAQAGALPPDHEPKLYPKWKYHATQEARIVDDKEAELELGDWWFDRPDLVKTEPAKAEPKKAERASA